MYFFSAISKLLIIGLCTTISFQVIALSSRDISSSEAIESYLAQFKDQDELLARTQLIKALANSLPNESQLQWVKAQLQSEEQILQSNIEHPNQQLIIASVAGSAKATLLHWEITRLAQQYKQIAKSNNWNWSAYLQSDNGNKSQALKKMLSMTSNEGVNLLQQALNFQLMNDKVEFMQLSNEDLLTLVARQSNVDLSTQLLQRPVNEFSYQHIGLIPRLYSSEEAISLLQSASEHERLTSQALMVMAKSYGNHQEAQSHLLERLQQPKNAWFAAAAISLSKNEQLNQQVMQMKKTSAAIQFTQKNYTDSLANKEEF